MLGQDVHQRAGDGGTALPVLTYFTAACSQGKNTTGRDVLTYFTAACIIYSFVSNYKIF
jgi:hypothetical protein